MFLSLILWGSRLITSVFAQTNDPVPPGGELTTPFRVEIVASGLMVPWSIVFTPDHRMFFTERPGWVRVAQGDQVMEQPALVLKDVVPSVKMGLLGLAIHPGFDTNHFLYLAYNYETAEERYFLRVVRHREQDNRLVEPFTLLEGIPAYRNHTGCRLRFGPDGCLYITTGDANQPPLAQRLDSFAGKILRIRPNGSVPPDNPFVKRPEVLPAIWSYGHRNPQGLAFQPGTHALFAPEHGPDHGDEINLIIRGANYGWPLVDHRRSREGLRSPVMEFTPAIGPAAATFYTGKAFPELRGKLLVGCLRGEGILAIGFQETSAVSCHRLLHYQYGRIREVTEGSDGFIYFTTSQFDPPEGTPRAGYDMILRLVPQSAPATGAALAAPWQGERREVALHPSTTKPEELIAVYCAACHGPGLRGGLQRGLLYGNWQFARNDEELQNVIHRGLGDKGMPGFGAALNPEQISSLLQYIRDNQSSGPEPAGSRPDPATRRPSEWE